MKLLPRTFALAVVSIVALALSCRVAEAQSAAGQTSVKTIVTVLGPSFTAPPPLGKEDVIPTSNKQRADVTHWDVASGEHGALDLAILIDDSTEPTIANQFEEIRKFLLTQSKSTRIGIFYSQNGTAHAVAPFTEDHEAAAKSLRLPLGFDSSPDGIFLPLMDLVAKWPATSARREIFVIADGIDRYRGDPNSPDVTATIRKAQKDGIMIHTIYARNTDRFSRNMFRVNYGISNLGQMSDETGGETFTQGTDTPISFRPFLDQLDAVLHNQYWLTISVPRSTKKNGEYRDLRIRTEQHNAEISAPAEIFVPAS